MGILSRFGAILFTSVLVLSGCGISNVSKEKNVKAEEKKSTATKVFGPHEHVNQKPIPVKINRIGENEVNIEMTAQITDIEISKGDIYKAWTFNGEAPGPVIVVNQGDKINFKLTNMDPSIPHSMDFHAVHAAPSTDFANVMPDKTGNFSYPANNPGVFMYHCGTKPVLAHIANGMHGTIIVKPKEGYPTDSEVDREFVIIQNEWYKYNDLDDFTNGVPKYVVFSTKALKDGDANTNGAVGALVDKPLLAKVGDKVRFYVMNVGPNEVSSFHVVGTVMDDVFVDGNPFNHLKGLQTLMLPASGGAVAEFTVTKEGSYPFVTHQFNHVTKGAAGILKVTKDGHDDGSVTMSH